VITDDDLHALAEMPAAPPDGAGARGALPCRPVAAVLARGTRLRRRRTHRRRGVAAATAALVVAVPTWLVARRDPAVDTTTGPSTTASTTTSTTPSTTSSTTTTPASGVATDPFGDAAPWTGPPLPASTAPAYVEAAGTDPDAAAQCPVLAPDDLGEGAGATPRASTGGGVAWAVQYDLPGGPGEPDDVSLTTPEAGGSTFTVAAYRFPTPVAGWGAQVGVDSVDDLVTGRGRVHTWSDGTVVGWGEGIPGPGPAADGEAIGWAADLWRPDADPLCLYTVSSYLGEEHVLHLIEHLRRVEGT
jgi:hypothetical protein